jgi:cation diffusion facilitator family transporter
VTRPDAPPFTRHTPERTTAANLRAVRQPAVRRTLAVVLALNVAVVAAKLIVGIRSGSLAAVGAALESTLDLINNAIGITVVSIAAQAPDEEHPYGHDKFESLGALAIVGFLSISCFELIRESVSQLLHRNAPLQPTFWDVAMLAGAAAVNLGVTWYERSRGRALGSAILLADAAHTTSDFLAALLAIIALVLARAGYGGLDAPLALVVAVVIMRNGYLILKGSVPVLVDQRAVDAERVGAVVRATPGVSDVRLVRSRATASGLLFVEVTLGVAGSTSVAEGHAIADAVEEQITKAWGAAEVTVHVEPA